MRGALVAACLALATATPASALPLEVSGTLSLLVPVPAIGVGIQPIVFDASPDPLPVSTSGGAFGLPAGVFTGTYVAPTPPLTGGIPPLTGLESVSVSAGAGSFAPSAGPAGGFGGVQPVGGTTLVSVLGGLINLRIPLSMAGVGGVSDVTSGSLMLRVTASGWTTGAARVTGITTAIVRTVGGAVGPQLIVGNRQFVTPTFYLLNWTAEVLSLANTVTLSGSDGRTPGGLGTLTLVTPVRVLSNVGVQLPLFAVQQFEFRAVPEPGPAALIAVGLACVALGARRLR